MASTHDSGARGGSEAPRSDDRAALGVPPEHSIAFVTAAALELRAGGEWVAGHGIDTIAPEEGPQERNPKLTLEDLNGALGCAHEIVVLAGQLPARDELPTEFVVWAEPGALRSVLEELVSSVYVKAISERVLDNPTALEGERLTTGKQLTAGLAWALDHLEQVDAAMARQERGES